MRDINGVKLYDGDIVETTQSAYFKVTVIGETEAFYLKWDPIDDTYYRDPTRINNYFCELTEERIEQYQVKSTRQKEEEDVGGFIIE